VSKTIPIALANHYAQPWHTIATCLKVTRTDDEVHGYTSHDHPLVFDGLTYEPGFDISTLSSASGLAVDNLELSVQPLPDEEDLAADLRSGRWDNAAFQLFEVNYNALTVRNVLKNGHLGEVRFRSTHYVVEFRSLTQALQQTQGIVTSKTCRARLGDEKCTLNLAPFTYTGTITAVDGDDPQRIFTDSARAEAGGWFAEGIFQILTGANAGFRQKVKIHEAGGAFQLSLPMPYPMAPGDNYSVIAGCRKRLEEDCIAKFNNPLNFQGEPHLPGLDALTKPGGTPTQETDVPPPLPSEPIMDGDGGSE
jgi:uncharacterized phage protein (TIGR02218 family)